MKPIDDAVRERVRRVRAGEPIDVVYDRYYKKLRLAEYVRDLEAVAEAALAENPVTPTKE